MNFWWCLNWSGFDQPWRRKREGGNRYIQKPKQINPPLSQSAVGSPGAACVAVCWSSPWHCSGALGCRLPCKASSAQGICPTMEELLVVGGELSFCCCIASFPWCCIDSCFILRAKYRIIESTYLHLRLISPGFWVRSSNTCVQEDTWEEEKGLEADGSKVEALLGSLQRLSLLGSAPWGRWTMTVGVLHTACRHSCDSLGPEVFKGWFRAGHCPLLPQWCKPFGFPIALPLAPHWFPSAERLHVDENKPGSCSWQAKDIWKSSCFEKPFVLGSFWKDLLLNTLFLSFSRWFWEVKAGDLWELCSVR